MTAQEVHALLRRVWLLAKSSHQERQALLRAMTTAQTSPKTVVQALQEVCDELAAGNPSRLSK